MDSGDPLIEVIRSCRKVWEQQHQYLTPTELDDGWKVYWDSITSHVNGSSGPGPRGSVIPQKRSATDATIVGSMSTSKRPGLVGTSY